MNAYVTLVMRGAYYIPGAIVLGYSCKKHCKFPVVCMVTDDVPKCAVAALSGVYDRVIKVDKISKGTRKQSFNFDKLYSSWIHDSYTKWRCLELIEYDKVMFIDADCVILECIDDIFELNTPAGTFRSPYMEPYAPRALPNFYGHLEHGDRVPACTILESMKMRSTTVIASNILLSPSTDTFVRAMSILSADETYGRDDTRSGPDEQLISDTYISLGKDFTNIDPVYGACCGKLAYLEGKDAKVYHYYHDKPWSATAKRYPDWEVYDKYASRCMLDHPDTVPFLDRRYTPIFCPANI